MRRDGQSCRRKTKGDRRAAEARGSSWARSAERGGEMGKDCRREARGLAVHLEQFCWSGDQGGRQTGGQESSCNRDEV